MRFPALIAGLLAFTPVAALAAADTATEWICTMTSQDSEDGGEQEFHFRREENALINLSAYSPMDMQMTIILDNETALIASGGIAGSDNQFHPGSLDHITFSIRHRDGRSTMTVSMLANTATMPESHIAAGTCVPSAGTP